MLFEELPNSNPNYELFKSVLNEDVSFDQLRPQMTIESWESDLLSKTFDKNQEIKRLKQIFLRAGCEMWTKQRCS